MSKARQNTAMKSEIVKTKVKFVKILEDGIRVSIWYWKIEKAVPKSYNTEFSKTITKCYQQKEAANKWLQKVKTQVVKDTTQKDLEMEWSQIQDKSILCYR